MHRHFRRTAVLLAAAALSFAHAAAAEESKSKLDIGDKPSAWKNLVGTDGKKHALADHKKAKVVVVSFICNHCPVAEGYEKRFMDFAEKYKKKGVVFVAVSISDIEEDSLEKMTERAKERKFSFEYLHDPTQEIGRAFGAQRTPHVFVLDKKRQLAYRGAFDNSILPARVTELYVADAVDELLAGKRVSKAETRSAGCPITYQPKREEPKGKANTPPKHTADSLDTIKERLKSGKAILLDVREQSEWDDGHLKSARLVPLSELRKRADDPKFAAKLGKDVSKKKIIYCHCRSGGRVIPASAILQKLGYDIRPLKNGYADLVRAGFAKAEE